MSDKSFKFDKFVNDIVRREQKHKPLLDEKTKGMPENPQRRYTKRYSERWQNRIVWKKHEN